MIPLCEPDLTGKEREYVAEAIASGWVSGGGPYVERFERMVADACGARWAVATLTGTAALHVALKATGMYRRIDSYKMRSMTFIGAANAVRYCGAEPYFVDIEDDWTPDYSRVGRVWDAAPAIGAFAVDEDLACFSFNGNKTVTTGQGGAVAGNDRKMEERVHHLVNVAKRGPYSHDDVGFNYRMANINAAMGCAQMERLPFFMERKRRIMARYREAGIDLITSMWMAVMKTDDPDRTIIGLEGIYARQFWKPVHRQLPYHDCPRYDLPNTEAIWDKLVCLPCSTNLTEAGQDKVIKCVESLQ